jgi:rSAM/selenodomain-associated transferase 2
MTEPPFLLSVIVPTLDEAPVLAGTLGAVARLGGPVEVIVVDGGSRDETVAVARRCGARVVAGRRGRGPQMHAGARAARGEVLWFLHADTLPPPDAVRQIRAALAAPGVAGGHFAIHFDGDETAARFLTWLYPHLGRFGLRYGDSGIFVRREVYHRIGGFRAFPLFEDLDLICRLQQRGRFVRLPGVVRTSSRRFRGRSFALTFLRWVVLQLLYWLGVPPHTLGRLYRPIRRAGH